MWHKFATTFLASFFCVALLFQQQARAQDRFEISLFPAYHVINSDKVSAAPNVSRTDWVFGGNITARFRIRDLPLAYSIGYSQGKSTILETDFRIPPPISNYSVDLRYRTLPQELFLVTAISDRVGLLTGINVTAQDRTLQYTGLDLKDDRLFSMGVGLSGKIHMVLNSFSSGNGHTFVNLAVRWTEFIYHDANNRNLDDFTLRHVSVSPQFGVSYSFN